MGDIWLQRTEECGYQQHKSSLYWGCIFRKREYNRYPTSKPGNRPNPTDLDRESGNAADPQVSSRASAD
ncbi:hypothetical protein EIP91_012223 [Steccherinum ochraceum]|uniref:Uncharacterized protein n=1 Tax=Steccherinum ochraceum TaxID=92696 RepID=A0A4R0RKY9_9APHY|nr:hypothetical protein EIP91_012223 [Steccherinum ochraceum]